MTPLQRRIQKRQQAGQPPPAAQPPAAAPAEACRALSVGFQPEGEWWWPKAGKDLTVAEYLGQGEQAALPPDKRDPSFRNGTKTFQLHVQVLFRPGESFTLDNALESDLVGEIKMRVADQIGMPIEDQRLAYRGTVLKNDKRLREYEIRSHVTLKLTRPPSADF